MAGKRDHFLPRHYLRQFRFEQTEQVAIATLDPSRFVGLGPIDRQCQARSFYENNEPLNQILWQSENDLAPVLTRVSKTADFDAKERVALNFLAALLRLRTKTAVEEAKVFPRRIAHEVISHGIESGRLPAPRGGWREEMMDFTGVPGTVIAEGLIPCWMEMQTLDCKLLRVSGNNFFITSDNPAAILNQFAFGSHPVRSFAGFAQSGFQLVLPLSPQLCAFFYDPKVYKVGQRRRRLVEISSADASIVNSLQVQSADDCIYFHDPTISEQVLELVRDFQHLRTPVTDALRTYPTNRGGEEILHMRARSARLPQGWAFCRWRRHVAAKPGDRRDPAWSHVIEQLSDDLHKNPGGAGVFERLKKLGFYDGPLDA